MRKLFVQNVITKAPHQLIVGCGSDEELKHSVVEQLFEKSKEIKYYCSSKEMKGAIKIPSTKLLEFLSLREQLCLQAYKTGIAEPESIVLFLDMNEDVVCESSMIHDFCRNCRHFAAVIILMQRDSTETMNYHAGASRFLKKVALNADWIVRCGESIRDTSLTKYLQASFSDFQQSRLHNMYAYHVPSN